MIFHVSWIFSFTHLAWKAGDLSKYHNHPQVVGFKTTTTTTTTTKPEVRVTPLSMPGEKKMRKNT